MERRKPLNKPTQKPKRIFFSSGPTSKRPGWDIQSLKNSLVGRSHRSKIGKKRIQEAVEKSRQLGKVPEDYFIGIMPASDTGAFECAMWSLLGERKVSILVWESFGAGWATDITKQLKIDAEVKEAPYGEIPDLSSIDFNNDIVFTWNGTTSGVKVPDGNWIPDDRAGLTLCDATSAMFAMDIPWNKIDVATYSWQKVLGGEAAHGILILSPRAVKRLESYDPPWPMPKIFRLKKGGKLNKEIFEGSTINTPSMIAVEDFIDALDWGLNLTYDGKKSLEALMAKSQHNLKVVEDFVESHDWIEFLPKTKEIRSSTSICISVVAPWFVKLSNDEKTAFCKKLSSILEEEKVAYDINAYRDAPPGFRFWGGPTVDAEDLQIALQWLEWAYEENKQG